MIVPESGSWPVNKTWNEARSHCLSLGGDLASVRNRLENERIKAFLDQLGVDGDVWIGGNDAEEEGHFKWSDGRPFLFLDWLPGEPNSQGEEDCMQLFPRNAKRQWNDKICSYESPFICKISI